MPIEPADKRGPNDALPWHGLPITLHRPRRASLDGWLLAAGILVAAKFVIEMTGETNPYKSPTRGLISAGLTGSLIALAITGIVALLSRRRAVTADVFRMACWCFVGGCLAVYGDVPAPRYFVVINGFWPPFLDSVRTLSQLGAFAGPTAIVAATVLFRPPPAPKSGCCSRCGYNLTGNISGICPECGTPTS